MKPVFEDWTIVVVGSWNTAILNPDWVSKKVLGVEEVGVELMVGPGTMNITLHHPGLRIIPTRSRVIVGAQEEASVPSAETAMVTILEQLPVTPVTSMGINFGYVESNPSSELLAIFNLTDTDRLSDAGHEIVESSVYRSFKAEGVFTHKLRLTLAGGEVKLHSNFHLDVTDAEAAAAALKGATADRNTWNKKFLADMYDLHEGGE